MMIVTRGMDEATAWTENTVTNVKIFIKSEEMKLVRKKKRKIVQLLLLSKFVTAGKHEIIRWVEYL